MEEEKKKDTLKEFIFRSSYSHLIALLGLLRLLMNSSLIGLGLVEY